MLSDYTGKQHYNKEGSELMSGKLPGVPVNKFQKALKNAGYKKDRCNGGHEIWEKTITKSVSIPIHEKEINGGMARRLAKELGLKEV